MKKHLFIFLTLALTLLAGCRSKQQVAVVSDDETAATWQNVSLPVTLTISEPMKLTLSGTLTMVRGEYALMSFRTFGFEVAQACVTPDQLDVVLKMPSKMWISESMGERLTSRGLTFADLQDQMLSDSNLAQKIPGATISESNGKTTISVSTTVSGAKLSVDVSYKLSDAKWDASSPATFSTPGSDYKKLTLESAAKSLGQ